MGAVGGVAILGGNFEAATFPEDKVVQRSLTAGTQESSAIDAVILDALPLGAPGQLDSHAFLWKGHSNDGSPHTIDWKAFVNVTADDGTGSLWTLQTRIDGAPYTDILTVDDNGLLTVSGATFTMDQLIIDTDNAEAIIVRKDGDAGDVFIVDTINDGVRLASNDTFLTFGASSDVRLERAGPRALQINSVPGIADSGDNELRIIAIDDGASDRWLELFSGTSAEIARVRARRALGGASYHLDLVTDSGSMRFFTDGVQRWTILTTAGGDSEFAPFITNRYDLGTTALAVRNVYTNGVLIGQDKTAAYDAITIDGTDLAAPGQQDSGAIILTGLSNDGSAHDIDWKQFVNVTANDGTGSIWTLQSRLDAVAFVDEFTVTSTTSPTLVSIGPGSSGGALAFGPSASAAQAGTIRFQFTDDVRYRNEGDDGDLIFLSFGESSKAIIGESGIPVIEMASQFNVINEMATSFDGTAAFAIRSTTRTLFAADTTNLDIELLTNVARPASVVDRFKMLGRNQDVNSTVGFSGAILLEGQAREAGGTTHDATWRMYVEPLTTTAFDGQSVFKITAEIDTGGPTTVFTLSDTGDLIVPGSFTIDGLIVDVTSTEAFLVRKNADGGDVFNVDTSGDLVQVIGSSALTIGTNPASTGSLRMAYAGSIISRNNNNSGDLTIYDFGDSNEIDFGDAAMPVMRMLASRLETNRIRITHTIGTALEVNNDGNSSMFLVDTSGNIVSVGKDVALQIATSVDRLILGPGPILTGDSTAAESHTFLIQGRTRTSGSVQHTSDWRMTVQPFSTTAFDGQSQLSFTGGIDGAGLTTVVTMDDGGRFAITQPEQVSIGSPTFIDNVQVNITGSFIDDYGGGPTETHKLKIQGGQTGDAGRTNRQTSVDVDTFIITQNLSQTINEVGAMFIDAPALTIGTDTVTKAYTLKVNGYPTDGTENYGLLVDGAQATANLTALVRIGKQGLQTGIKLLVGGSVGFDNLVANSQMRLTGIYTSDGTVDSATLLHVHTTLLPEDGTTDHITGAFFQGSLRTQVAVESVANISQVRIDEPNIQDNLTGDITNAQSLLITGAPTEGVDNWAFRILSGDVEIGGDLIEFGAGGGNSRMTFRGCSTFYLGNLDTPDEMFFGAGSTVTVASAVASFDNSRFKFRTGAANGQFMEVRHAEAVVSTPSGSSATAAGLIPAGSFVIGITTRVQDPGISGPAGFDVGDGIDVDRWGNSLDPSSNAISDIRDFTSGAVTLFPTANDVVITSDGVDFTGGSVRITVQYLSLNAGTS
jgi:hypothetical protein